MTFTMPGQNTPGSGNERVTTELVAASDMALVDAFVRRHYGFRGALALHRHAFGWDLLRAPANVVLAPVVLAVRLAAVTAHFAGLRDNARWLARRRIQFRSNVSLVLEADLLREVIVPRAGGQTTADPDLLARLKDYTAVRVAISEIGTTLLVVIIGLAAYQSMTPGVLSLAPVVTDRAAEAREIANFPLGETLGAAWHGLFPSKRPFWHVLVVGVGLVVAFSLVSTFSGLLADPVQAAFGGHRRRLLRLLARLDQVWELAPRVEGEYVVARAGDIADIAAAVIRFIRH